MKVKVPVFKNTMKEYVSVRVTLIHVKKGLLSYKDTELARNVVIPDDSETSAIIFEKFRKLMEQYGVTLTKETTT